MRWWKQNGKNIHTNKWLNLVSSKNIKIYHGNKIIVVFLESSNRMKDLVCFSSDERGLQWTLMKIFVMIINKRKSFYEFLINYNGSNHISHAMNSWGLTNLFTHHIHTRLTNDKIYHFENDEIFDRKLKHAEAKHSKNTALRIKTVITHSFGW